MSCQSMIIFPSIATGHSIDLQNENNTEAKWKEHGVTMLRVSRLRKTRFPQHATLPAEWNQHRSGKEAQQKQHGSKRKKEMSIPGEQIQFNRAHITSSIL